MNCENYKNLIDDLVEKRLDEPTSQKVFFHLLDCQSCEAEFETRFEEKEICTDFLFEVKPVNNLSEQFQTKLKIEKQKEIAATHYGFGGRLKNILSLLSLKPILAGAVILLMFGVMYLSLKSSTNNSEQKIITQSEKLTPVFTTESNLPTVANFDSETPQISKNEGKQPRNSVVKTKAIAEKWKVVAVNSAAIKKSNIQKDETKKLIETPKTNNEDDLQLTQIKSFMDETGIQLEKTEMLFRSFRNARLNEESGTFDISYEKEQAHKLLERNVRLRKIAENYGSYDLEETLKTTESLLSEIADLENKPSQEQVISIKRRVNSQNIIAALQVY